MYTEDDVKRMLAKNAGEKNFSSAKSVGYTSDDVKRMLKNVIPSQRTLKDDDGNFTEVNRNYFPPTVDNNLQTTVNNKAAQQKANYDRLQQIIKNNSSNNTAVKPLSSGRDYVVNPGEDASARIGAGLKSIGQTALAAVPMLGATAKQAAENAVAAANSKDYAAKRAQLFMQQNGLSNTPEYENRKAQEQAAKQELNAVIENEQLNKPVAANTLGMRLMDKAKQSQAQAVEGLSPTGQFIGNTLISVGQNAALLPGAIVNPALPLAGMSAIAAADKSYELSKQGIGASEALSRGIISGSIEAATEKMPLDNLFKIANTAGGKAAIKNILKQMGTEATEETISYIANYIADKAAADPNAKFSLQDMTLSALGGALSGGIMGGGGSFYGLMRQNTVNDAQSGQNALQTEENPANSQTVGDLQGEVQSYSDTPKATDSVLSDNSKTQEQKGVNNSISEPNQNIPSQKPQNLQDTLYRLGEKGYAVMQGDVNVTAGERSGAYEQRKMREYGVNNIDDLIAAMTTEDYEEWQNRQAQDDEDRWGALMYDIDQQEMVNRVKAAATAGSEKVAEMLTNPDNGIIKNDAINESAQILANVKMAANKHISQVLDQAVKGAKIKKGEKDDFPLMPHESRQLRQMLYNAIEKPLSEAKAKYIAGIKGKAQSFAKDMERLGIKAGSAESAAVQWIGEGQQQGPDGELIEYTLSDLQQQFPENWQNILEASQICRKIYDNYIGEINEALKKVYPNVEKRAAELADNLNARIVYNRNQAQLWLDKAAQLEQKAANAATETHNVESVAEAKAADRANRLNNQAQKARETAERYQRAAATAEQKAYKLQRGIETGEILRNKRLMPRKDYFHHFNEMEQGLGGFINILTGSHDISAQLAGKSEFTKPKSKWWGALQQRTNGKYTADAVGGMAKYIPAAEYKIAFDPFIAQMRGTIEQLVNATEKTQNANSLIEYLTDWTNDLAGKTNFVDRPFQKLFDRKSIKLLEWLNNRAKANAVAGNIGSAIVQIGNIPNAMMFIKNPVYFAKAAQNIQTGAGKESESIFLNERYINHELDKLQNTNLLNDISNWMLEIGDKKAAQLIWNAAYLQYEDGKGKGLREYESAADYADDITRRSIGGRGIGEMALTQKSRIVKLFAPFQVEVNNTFNLIAEKIGEKDAAALLNYAMGAWAINSIIYMLTGRRPLFDPIDALIDAFKELVGDDEEERNTAEKIAAATQRLGGEIVSAAPYASTAAAMLTGTENSEKIFGEADPTRYGTGNIAVQTITKPIAQFLNGENVDLLSPAMAILPAYGGKQAERFIKGGQALGYLPDIKYSTEKGFEVTKNPFGASRSATGRIRFPITSPSDQVKTMLLGEWSTSRGKDYIEQGLSPMSDKQSEAMLEAFAKGVSPDDYYDAYLAQKKSARDREKIRLINEAVPHLSKAQKKKLYEAFGISKNAY